MSWGKLDDKFWRHPKVKKLRAQGAQGREALGVWLFWWSWCLDEQPRSGLVPESELPAADSKLAQLLVDVGLWDATPAGYNFHDFWVYNPAADTKADTKKEADRKRIAAKRELERRELEVFRELEAGQGRPNALDMALSDVADVADVSHATSRATSDATGDGVDERQDGDVECDYGDVESTVERLAPRFARVAAVAQPVACDVACDSSRARWDPLSPLPSPNSQIPSQAPLPPALSRDGGVVEFADDLDLEPGGRREPPDLERPTVELVREAYAAAYRVANGNRAPSWSRSNLGALRTVANWVDGELGGENAAPFVARLIKAFFAHEDAANAMVPIALLAANPAQYLAPTAHQGRRKGKGRSRDGFREPEANGSYVATDLDKVFGKASRVAEGNT